MHKGADIDKQHQWDHGITDMQMMCTHMWSKYSQKPSCNQPSYFWVLLRYNITCAIQHTGLLYTLGKLFTFLLSLGAFLIRIH